MFLPTLSMLISSQRVSRIMRLPGFLKSEKTFHGFMKRSPPSQKRQLLAMKLSKLKAIRLYEQLPLLVPFPKIFKGDLVQVLWGKNAGQRGKVLSVSRERGRVCVEGINAFKKVSPFGFEGVNFNNDTYGSVDYSTVSLIDPTLNEPTAVEWVQVPQTFIGESVPNHLEKIKAFQKLEARHRKELKTKQLVQAEYAKAKIDAIKRGELPVKGKYKKKELKRLWIQFHSKRLPRANTKPTPENKKLVESLVRDPDPGMIKVRVSVKTGTIIPMPKLAHETVNRKTEFKEPGRARALPRGNPSLGITPGTAVVDRTFKMTLSNFEITVQKAMKRRHGQAQAAPLSEEETQ